MFHGTGDIYSSTLFGGLINGLSFLEAGILAVKFVTKAIKNTLDVADSHWYGVCFEPCLKLLTNYKYPNKKAL